MRDQPLPTAASEPGDSLLCAALVIAINGAAKVTDDRDNLLRGKVADCVTALEGLRAWYRLHPHRDCTPAEAPIFKALSHFAAITQVTCELWCERHTAPIAPDGLPMAVASW